MKIDAIQMMNYNKKSMANHLMNEGAVVSNVLATNPDGTLEALNLQGNYNNPAFGMSPAVKKFVKPMMALAVMAGAAGLQSCEKYEEIDELKRVDEEKEDVVPQVNVNISQTTNVNVDFSAVSAAIIMMSNQLQMMYQQQQIDSKKYDDMMALIMKWMQMNGANSQAMLIMQLAQMGTDILENDAAKDIVVGALVNNNVMTKDQAMQYVEQYAQLVKEGKATVEQFMKDVISKLTSIDGNVAEILAKLKANANVLIEIAKTQEQNGKINQAQLNALIKTVNVLLNKVDKQNELAKSGNTIMEYILAEIKDGKISIEEAMQQLLDMVDDIKATLDVHTDLFIEMCENQDATNKYLKSYTDAFRKAVNTIMAKIDMNTAVTGQGNALAYQANQLILQLIEEVKAGKIDFQEAIQKILDLGNDIKATLDVHTDLFIDMCEKQDSTNEYLKTYTDAFRKAVKAITAGINMNTAVTGQGNMLTYQTNQLILQLIEEVKAGKIDFNEAIQKILELGNDIKASIDVNTTVLKGMAQVQVNNGKITQAQLNKLTNAINQLNAKANINNTFAAEANKMLKQLIADVEAGKITIEEATAQLIAMMNDIVTIIKQDGDRFQSIVDILLENRQIDQQHHDEIIAKINNIYEEVKNGNLTEAQAYNELIELVKEGNMIELDTNGVLKKFYQAWADHEAGTQETYDKIINLLDIISGKLDKIINQMTSDAKVATERFNAYSSYFKEVIDKIGKGGGSAADLTKVEALIAEVSAKESSILDAIKSQPACEGMTYAEFKAYMDQRDPKFVAAFEAMFDSFGDEILNKLDDMSDLQEVMIGDFDEFQADCLGLLGKIYNSVKDLDLVELEKNNPEKYDYLMNEILEPFKCHCCKCDCPDYTLILKEIEQKLDKWNEGIKDPGDLFSMTDKTYRYDGWDYGNMFDNGMAKLQNMVSIA